MLALDLSRVDEVFNDAKLSRLFSGFISFSFNCTFSSIRMSHSINNGHSHRCGLACMRALHSQASSAFVLFLHIFSVYIKPIFFISRLYTGFIKKNPSVSPSQKTEMTPRCVHGLIDIVLISFLLHKFLVQYVFMSGIIDCQKMHLCSWVCTQRKATGPNWKIKVFDRILPSSSYYWYYWKSF